MSIFSYIRSIYALDTLDTRFTNASSTSYQTVIDTRTETSAIQARRDDSVPGNGGKLDRRGRPLAQPSLWRTKEFKFYYFVFATIVPYMFWICYDVSRPSDPNYHKYEEFLEPGWIPGRKIDLSDYQYSFFRGSILYLLILLIVHPNLRNLYNNFYPVATRNQSSKTSGSSYVSTEEGDARLEQRVSFDFLFSLVLLVALHGFSAFKIFVILYINYAIATQLPRKYVPAVTWVYNIGTLFANELSEGYRLEKMASYFAPLQAEQADTFLHITAKSIDAFGGLASRWEVLFNLTVLRLISFNLDYYWSLDRRGGSPIEKKQLDPANLSERDRVVIPAPTKDYTFRNYFAYATYAPLYLAGPIVTFNDYISQNRFRSATIEKERTIKYGIRFLMCLLCIELVLHFDYCGAITKGNPNWDDYSPAQLTLLSYFNLHILWLKLLIPWRFFRLWSLVDGIDPPENMLRCVSNNPSTIAFWRGWHRSFNRWIIRYIYVPLGGSDARTTFGKVRLVFNYVLVFTFVALWHDISLNLLYWGWLIVFFMVPEIIAGYIFPRKKYEDNLTAHRMLCSAGAVCNMVLMMMANLVGFAVGIDGLKTILHGIIRDYSGLAFLTIASSSVFVGCQVMFEVRQGEMRKGIHTKC